MKINLNESVKVKLTPFAQEIYKQQIEDLNKRIGKTVVIKKNRNTDKDGYSTFQLWDFIETFGAYIGMGRPNIIEPLEIVYEQEAHHADD